MGMVAVIALDTAGGSGIVLLDHRLGQSKTPRGWVPNPLSPNLLIRRR